MIMYEIHQYRAGKWHLDSVYDNEDLALDEAERVEALGTVQAIRVVEVYDKNNPARNRVVFRGGEVELRREAARTKEPHISLAQIVGLVVTGVVALGVWIYLQLN
jgi:hypothetical protein